MSNGKHESVHTVLLVSAKAKKLGVTGRIDVARTYDGVTVTIVSDYGDAQVIGALAFTLSNVAASCNLSVSRIDKGPEQKEALRWMMSVLRKLQKIVEKRL